jgi:hypothetical protein
LESTAPWLWAQLSPKGHTISDHTFGESIGKLEVRYRTAKFFDNLQHQIASSGTTTHTHTRTRTRKRTYTHTRTRS